MTMPSLSILDGVDAIFDCWLAVLPEPLDGSHYVVTASKPKDAT
jgi:hypothetical protein